MISKDSTEKLTAFLARRLEAGHALTDAQVAAMDANGAGRGGGGAGGGHWQEGRWYDMVAP